MRLCASRLVVFTTNPHTGFHLHNKTNQKEQACFTCAFYSKNCGLPFLTDRSGNNAQSYIFIIYYLNQINHLFNKFTALQLHAMEEL